MNSIEIKVSYNHHLEKNLKFASYFSDESVQQYQGDVVLKPCLRKKLAQINLCFSSHDLRVLV
jgi:hypothetical protein